MNTALKTVIQQALSHLPFLAPDYSASASDIAHAITADFHVHPRFSSTPCPECFTGLCFETGPVLILEGTPQPALHCELIAGHEGAHRSNDTHWGPIGPSFESASQLATDLFPSHVNAATVAGQWTDAGMSAAVDTDLAIAHLARSLTATPHSLTTALTALAEWVNAGGDPTQLPKPSATNPFEALFGRYFAAEVDLNAHMTELSVEVAKTVQANDVAGIVIDQAQLHMPSLFVTLDLRYGIADALWEAGYRNEATAGTGTAPVSADDERMAAWDKLVRHPFFASCFATDGPLIDAMIAKLDSTTPPKHRDEDLRELQHSETEQQLEQTIAIVKQARHDIHRWYRGTCKTVLGHVDTLLATVNTRIPTGGTQ